MPDIQDCKSGQQIIMFIQIMPLQDKTNFTALNIFENKVETVLSLIWVGVMKKIRISCKADVAQQIGGLNVDFKTNLS